MNNPERNCINCGVIVDLGNSLCKECADDLAKTNENPVSNGPDTWDATNSHSHWKGIILFYCPSCGTSVNVHDWACQKCGKDFFLDTSEYSDDQKINKELNTLNQSDNEPVFHSTKPLVQKITQYLFYLIGLSVAWIICFSVYRVSASATINSNVTSLFILLFNILLLQILFFIPIFRYQLLFVDQAYRNLNALGITSLKYSQYSASERLFGSDWNVVFSNRIFAELWKASDPTISRENSPGNNSSYGVTKLWWIVCSISIVLTLLLVYYLVSSFIFNGSSSFGWLYFIDECIIILFAVLTLRMNGKIDQRLEQKKWTVIAHDVIVVKETRIAEDEVYSGELFKYAKKIFLSNNEVRS